MGPVGLDFPLAPLALGLLDFHSILVIRQGHKGQRHLMDPQHLPVQRNQASPEFQAIPAHSNNLSHIVELISPKMCYCMDDEVDT